VKPPLVHRAALVMVAAVFAAPPRFAARTSAPERSLAPWTYHADFAKGLAGWMSFPLAQDIGFDPSLFTAQEDGRTVLVRDVEPYARNRVRLGVIRPIDCVFGPSGFVDLEYVLQPAGRATSLDLVLAGKDGHRYVASLSLASGSQRSHVTGAQLGVPAEGAQIEAVALLARVEAPHAAGNDRLTISDFTLTAERRAEVTIAVPALDRSEPGLELVSSEVLRAPLPLRIRIGAPEGRVQLIDPSGKQVAATTLTGEETAVRLGSDSVPGLWTAKVTSGSAETDFRFLVIGNVPPHPRILLRDERLDQLRREPQYAALRDQIHKQAQKLAKEITYNAAAGDNIATLPGGTGLHAGFVGELKAYFKVLEGYANAISYNALDSVLNGDEGSLQAARRALMTVARWKTWTPPRFTQHGLHTYYEVGVFAQRVALGYDLIAAHLAPPEKEQIARAFRTQLIDPTIDEYFLADRMPLAASNWMANSLGGALAAAVAIHGDVAESDPRAAGALAPLTAAYERLLEGLFPRDGSEVEPAGYENFAMQGISWASSALDALGVHPRGERRMLDGFWWPYYAMVTPSLVLDTGDFDGRLERLSGFAWGAEHAHIPALRDFYSRSSTYIDLSAPSDVQHTGRDLEQATGPLDLVCCSAAITHVPPPPSLSRMFDRRGSVVFRSGWTPESTVVSLRAGPWFNHEHHDQGSFQVAAFGDHLIAEAGYSGYYDDPNYPTYFTQAPGHNTVLLDGDAFSQVDFNGSFWKAFDDRPHLTAHVLGDAFDFVRADLTSAYAGRVDEYKREFVFVKPDLLVVRDLLSTGAPHAFSWLLHAPAGAKLSANADRAVIETPHARADVLGVMSGDSWKVEENPISILKFDDLEHGAIQKPRTLHLEAGSRQGAEFLVGVSVSRAGARGAELRTLTGMAAEGVAREGTTRDSVAFRTQNGALDVQGFSTDGSVLAIHSDGTAAAVLAIGAHELWRGGAVLLRSTAPADIEWQPSPGGLTVHLHTAGAADLQISGRRPASVDVDGSAQRFTFSAGMAVVRDLPGGDHRVAIRY
jgi:heparinase II/III-like protein